MDKLTIESLESFLWEYFGESYIVKANPKADAYMVLEREGVYNIQDIGPALADFLHERGVSIDWSDGSRYGTVVTAAPSESK